MIFALNRCITLALDIVWFNGIGGLKSYAIKTSGCMIYYSLACKALMRAYGLCVIRSVELSPLVMIC